MFNSVEINSESTRDQVYAMVASIVDGTMHPDIEVEISNFGSACTSIIKFGDMVTITLNTNSFYTRAFATPTRFNLVEDHEFDLMALYIQEAGKFCRAFNLSAAGVFHTL